MLRPLPIGATALLLLITTPAWAEWRSSISGGDAILPPHFVLRSAPTEPVPDEPVAEGAHGGVTWALPLVDRRLSQAEKDADIASELIDAINRIEPMYDPTRLDGPDFPPVFGIRAGTASMDNVFADRWRMASPDANINRTARYIAMTWQSAGVLPCASFAKDRAHAEDEPALTTLTDGDCTTLLQTQMRGFSNPLVVPIVIARISVPVFAAPLPGSRQSSEDFWAAQRARIAAIQERLKERVRNHHAANAEYSGLTRVGLRQ